MLTVEDGKAELIERQVIDAREYLTFRTIVGDIFTLIKPDVSEAELERIKAMAREILRESNAGDQDKPR